MTRVYIDQREVPSLPHCLESLDEILKHVEKTELPPNTLIRQVHVDGLSVASEEYQKDPAKLAGRIQERERIEIVTGSVWEIAQDSLREADSYLDRVVAVTPSLALSFQTIPGPEAFDNLKQLYEGFYWLNLLLDRLESVLDISLDTVLIGGESVRDHHQKFIGILKQLVEAQEREDFILIADLLEYEILPLIPAWKALFSSLAETAVSRQ